MPEINKNQMTEKEKKRHRQLTPCLVVGLLLKIKQKGEYFRFLLSLPGNLARESKCGLSCIVKSINDRADTSHDS